MLDTKYLVKHTIKREKKGSHFYKNYLTALGCNHYFKQSNKPKNYIDIRYVDIRIDECRHENLVEMAV